MASTAYLSHLLKYFLVLPSVGQHPALCLQIIDGQITQFRELTRRRRKRLCATHSITAASCSRLPYLSNIPTPSKSHYFISVARLWRLITVILETSLSTFDVKEKIHPPASRPHRGVHTNQPDLYDCRFVIKTLNLMCQLATLE